jgi:hypothetical protein
VDQADQAVDVEAEVLQVDLQDLQNSQDNQEIVEHTVTVMLVDQIQTNHHIQVQVVAVLEALAVLVVMDVEHRVVQDVTQIFQVQQ